MNLITDDSKPVDGFLQAWWAFLKAEHATMRGTGSAKATKDAATHFRISEDQVRLFCLGEMASTIALVLWVWTAYDNWFTEHGLGLGKHANGSGLVMAVAMVLVSHVLTSVVLALIWLKIRRSMDPNETRQLNELDR